MNEIFSHDMHIFTEKVGSYLPEDAHKIIKHRYQVATKFSKGKNALEVGAGQGFGMQSIAKYSSKYTGIEYSSENIVYINESQSKYKVIQGDAHNMPFNDSEFQIINALAMIYYLDIDKFLNEARRILSLNGTLFFCTSNKDVPGFAQAPFTTKYYSIPELKKLLVGSGFEPKFYGSFAKYEQYEFLERLKVIIKNTVKTVVSFLPNGSTLWGNMRNKHLGGLKKLPNSIDDIEVDRPWESDFHALESDVNNSQYRIIYCVAKLKIK